MSEGKVVKDETLKLNNIYNLQDSNGNPITSIYIPKQYVLNLDTIKESKDINEKLNLLFVCLDRLRMTITDEKLIKEYSEYLKEMK